MPEAIEEVRPLRDGAIADYEGAMVLLRALILHARNPLALRRPRIVLSVPSELTQVERRALVSAARGAGAREVYLLAAPMAAALGAGVPAAERGGKLVVEIGAGTTEVAIVTLSGVVHARTMRMGGAKLDEAVRAWMKKKLDVEVGLAAGARAEGAARLRARRARITATCASTRAIGSPARCASCACAPRSCARRWRPRSPRSWTRCAS